MSVSLAWRGAEPPASAGESGGRSSRPDSSVMRSQFTRIKALIDALPAVTGAVVDITTTRSPGSAAAVSLSITGRVLHFAFTVPQGAEGQQGPPGEVTQSQLSNDLVNCQSAAVSTAMGLSSANSNGVSNLSGTHYSGSKKTAPPGD